MARRPRGLPRVPLDHPPVALRRDLFKSVGRAARARAVGVRRRAIRLRIRPAVASACLPASRSPVFAHRRDVIDQHPPLLLQGKGCQLRCETPSASRGCEAHKTSIVRVTHPVRCRTKLGRDAPGGMPFGNSGGGRFGDRDGGGRGYGRGGRGGMTMLGRDKVRPRRGPVSSSTHACTLAPR